MTTEQSMQNPKSGCKKELLYMYDVSTNSNTHNSLKQFRLRICHGEFIELSGVSGAGKTALFEYFTGDNSLETGMVRFKENTYRPPQKFENNGEVVCIGKKSSLISGLSVAENICIFSKRRKNRRIVKKKSMYYRVRLLIHQFVSDIEPGMNVDELTRVQKHAVELLRAVENDADLIYVDDIFSSYGADELAIIENLLLQLKERGMTIVVATRGKPKFSFLIDRLIVIKNGTYMKTFYLENYTEDDFERWMTGNSIVSQYNHISRCRNDEAGFTMNNISVGDCVQGLNLCVNKGEIVGAYDMNNYSNEIIARLAIGEIKPSDGNLQIGGMEYIPTNMEDVIGRKVGYIDNIYNHNGIVETMSYSDNILLPIINKMSRYGIINRKVERYVKNNYIEKLEMKNEKTGDRAGSLNIYTKVHIIMERWKLFRPDVLICRDICDESDQHIVNIIYSALEEMAENGTAVLITSHSMENVKAICDKIYIMNTAGANNKMENVIIRYTK